MKLKLIKGRSYSSGKIKVTAAKQFVETDDNKLAEKLIASGYFISVTEPGNGTPLTPSEKMTVEQLDKYAAEAGIDLTGCKNKSEKLTKIQEVLKTEGEKNGNINFDGEV